MNMYYNKSITVDHYEANMIRFTRLKKSVSVPDV